MEYLPENLHLIRNTWGLSATELPTLLKLNLSKDNIYSYEKSTNPSILFLFKMEEVTGLTIREMCNTKITKSDIPESPYRRGEGLIILADKAEDFKNSLEEPFTPYNPVANQTDNETILVQRKLIALLELRIKDLEKQIDTLLNKN